MDLKKTTGLLRDNAQLLNILRCYTDLGRSEICQLMNQSWPTVSKSIEDLKDGNVLHKDKEYAINSEIGYYVGISIGGSQIKLSIVDMSFDTFSKTEFEEFVKKYKIFRDLNYLDYSTKLDFGYVYTQTPNDIAKLQSILDNLLEEVIKLDKQLIEQDKHVYGVGLALTGAIDNKLKRIIKAYSLNCFTTLPLSYDSLIYDARLAYFNDNDINFSMDNIAKAAIISEKFALYDRKNSNARYFNRKNIACIYLGSGIGSSVIVDNKLYRGTSNFSELGHIDVIDPDFLKADEAGDKVEDVCSCGGKNCLEYKIRKYVFGSNFTEFSSLTATKLREKFNDEKNAEDKEYRLKLLAFYINQAIKILANVLNLDLVILTGKLTIFMDELSKYLYEEKSKNTIGYTNSDCAMVTSNYGALAPSIGAAITSSFPEGNDIIEWK